MSGEISKESLEAFTVATIKSATELEKIVSSLQIVVEKQDKIVDRVFNGMTNEIIEGVTKNYDNTHKETITNLEDLKKAVECNKSILTEKIPNEITEKLNISTIARDVEHTKWFVGIATIVIIIVSVLFKVIGINSNNKEEKVVEHLLKQHIKQTENVDQQTLP